MISAFGLPPITLAFEHGCLLLVDDAGSIVVSIPFDSLRGGLEDRDLSWTRRPGSLTYGSSYELAVLKGLGTQLEAMSGQNALVDYFVGKIIGQAASELADSVARKP